MIRKDQWVILPFFTAQQLPNLCISPPGVVPQRERRPRWIGDYSWSGVNAATQPLAPHQAMQFGHALDRFLRELLLANPAQGPLFLMKIDIADGFYRINVNPNDIPKLGLAFPTRPGHETSVALPLVLPMGWKNSPAFFSAATETAADLANQALQQASLPPAPHPLESHAALLDSPGPPHAADTPSVSPARPTHEPSLAPVSPQLSPPPWTPEPIVPAKLPLLQPSHSLLIGTPACHPVHGPPPM